MELCHDNGQVLGAGVFDLGILWALPMPAQEGLGVLSAPWTLAQHRIGGSPGRVANVVDNYRSQV